METQPAAKRASRSESGRSAFQANQPASGPSSPMASALTPSTVTPPAPKKSAWIASTSDSQTKAASGPKSRASRVTPVRWMEVPPGTGMRMVWTTKARAASEPTTGSDSAASRPKWRRAPQAQSGTATA